MPDEPATPVKKTTRVRKTSSTSTIPEQPSEAANKTGHLIGDFEDTIADLVEAKEIIEKLEKEISETKITWAKEQKTHEEEIKEQRGQEEVKKQRELETYDYETRLARKKSQDEFDQKKDAWEKDLASQKEQIASERKELADLRKIVEKYPEEKEKTVKDALTALEKSLRDQLDQEKKFLTQQHESEINVLNLKATNLESENSRQTKEIDILKKSLEDVTRQFREIAVKALESSRPEQKTTSQP